MDDWQRGIFYCKSLLIKHGVICWFLITFSVLIKQHARVFLSEMKLSVSLLRER